MENLQVLVRDCLSAESFQKAVISGKRAKSIEYGKVLIRPIGFMPCDGKTFQAEYHFAKKVTHKNLPLGEMVLLCISLLSEDFKQANFFSRDEEVQVLAAKIQRPHITRRKITGSGTALSDATQGRGAAFAAAQAEAATKGGGAASTAAFAADFRDLDKPVFSHNRTKNYIIPDGRPCDFLIRLGVMGKDGKVFQKHYSKFRQINRYLEIVDDVFPNLLRETPGYMSAERENETSPRPASSPQSAKPPQSSGPLKIIDFGCGKAYLTFALYYYIHNIKGLPVEIIGLDLKEDVIEFCNKVARDLGYENLKFLMGDIADYTNDNADMVVTLHACDTATDFALINAVSWNTKVILSVPCCQHELFKQIKNDIHQPMLKHGILKDRLTEYLTDGLRGLWLEAKGYNVSMIEFTGLEHTARNILIRAVKETRIGPAKKQKAANAKKQFDDLCVFYNLTPLIGKYL